MIVVSAGHAPGAAQTDQRQIERQQDQIQQGQQQRLDQWLRGSTRPETPPSPFPTPPETPAPEASSSACFTLKEVRFSDADHLSDDDRQDLTSPYIGHCVTIADINEILRKVTDLYAARGFVTTRAALPRQDVAAGTLTIHIVEGDLRGFRWNGEPADDRSEVLMAFPAEAGDLLDLRDLEQGLEQLDHLRSNHAKMQLLPGDMPGDSVVAIDNQPGNFWRVTAGMDNSGQSSTGALQAKASIELDDILGLDDYWGLFHSQDRLENSSQRGSQSWSLNFSIPYGGWRLNGTVTGMEYRSLISGQNQTFPGAGSQRAASIGVDRLLHRDGESKTFATLSLSYKSILNDVAGVVTDSSSPKLAILGVGLDDVRRLWGGALHGNLQYVAGIHGLGARGDSAWPDAPKAQFTAWRGDLSYGRPLSDFLDLTLTTALHGQWTNDALYGSEQIALGGEETIRGYKDQILSGNRGGSWRNEISAALPSHIASLDETLGIFHPFAAADIGVIDHFHPEDSVPGRLAGAATGLRLAGPWLEGELTYAWPLAHPARLDPPAHQLTFSLVVVL